MVQCATIDKLEKQCVLDEQEYLKPYQSATVLSSHLMLIGSHLDLNKPCNVTENNENLKYTIMEMQKRQF
jgi:hypothetical protein